MKLRFGVVLGVAACLLVAGCGKKEPSGQVVATVNDEEITAIDLRNELGGFKAPDAKTRKAAEQAALKQIVDRKLLVGVAKEQKLDKTPEFVQEKEKLDDIFLLRFWQNKIAKSVPPPSKEEVDRFIAANPDLYAAHKVLVLVQIRTPAISNPTLAAELKPLKTLPEVTQLLAAKKLPYQQGTARLDMLSIPPEIGAQIMKLPPQELFVMPQGNLATISQIREVQLVPLPPEMPNRHAVQYLTAQRTRQAVQRELGSALAAANREKDVVQYAKAYQPAPKAAAPAAPAKK